MTRTLSRSGISLSEFARRIPEHALGRYIVSAITIQLLLFSFSIRLLTAQDYQKEFEHISIEQGLSQAHVNCIFQDNKGFMWFGTQDGLNRYDGYSFTVYRHNAYDSTSISDNYVTAIAEDAFGSVWIGTQNGLNKFDEATDAFIRIEGGSMGTTPLQDKIVETICGGPDHSMWVGTQGRGLFVLTPVDNKSTGFKTDMVPDRPNSDTVITIYATKTGIMLIGTTKGLFRFDQKTKVLIRYSLRLDSDALSPGTIVKSIQEDGSGSIWVGTSQGLYILDTSGKQIRAYRYPVEQADGVYRNYIYCISRESNGSMWVGSAGGLEIYDSRARGSSHFVHDPAASWSLSDDIVMCIYEDRGGVVWLGTTRGLDRFRTRAKKFSNYRRIPGQVNSLSDERVWSICCDRNNRLWIGSNGGLDGIDRASNQYEHYRHHPLDSNGLSDNSVMSIIEDEGGELWIGTWAGGLNKFNSHKKIVRQYKDGRGYRLGIGSKTIMSMFVDHIGTLWLGTTSGVSQFDRKWRYAESGLARKTVPTSLENDRIYAIIEDHSHTMWFGTTRGLVQFDPHNNMLKRYRHDSANPSSLSNDIVLCICESKTGTMWTGTPEGLNSFEPASDQFVHFTRRDGLPNDIIFGILEDGHGKLWLSTNDGISRFDPSTKTCRNYDASDGLQSNEFDQSAYFKSGHGELFFGGINGVTSFFPDSLHDNPNIPPIVLTSFKVGDREKDLADACYDANPVQLSYKDNRFSFEFAALDYTRPEKNQYAYMLEGFDADWIYSGARRYASYTNLDPGNFILHLKGSNNDGVWNERGFSLRLWIAPPFWMTWWFRSSAILFLISSATISYVSRTRAINNRNRLLERKITEATAELNTTNESLQTEVLERRRSEDELWRYKHQLEEQVLERTAQLSQTVLSLEDQIAARVLAEQSLVAYQEKLRALAFDLSATEERERRRLSMYLHDSIGQTLAFCKIKLQSFQRSSRRARSDNRLREIQDMIEKSISDTRKLTLELSPPILHELGLVPAIEWLCKRFQGEHKIQFSLNADSQPLSIHQDLSNLLFHATREVIVNIIKHADATNAMISVHQDRDRICVEIRDDGCGFDAQRIQDNVKQHDAFGLFSVRERLHSLGGRMEIVSQRGSGTNVKLIIQNRPMAMGARGT